METLLTLTLVMLVFTVPAVGVQGWIDRRATRCTVRRCSAAQDVDLAGGPVCSTHALALCYGESV
jgi:hypothetical protein